MGDIFQLTSYETRARWLVGVGGSGLFVVTALYLSSRGSLATRTGTDRQARSQLAYEGQQFKAKAQTWVEREEAFGKISGGMSKGQRAKVRAEIDRGIAKTKQEIQDHSRKVASQEHLTKMLNEEHSALQGRVPLYVLGWFLSSFALGVGWIMWGREKTEKESKEA